MNKSSSDTSEITALSGITRQASLATSSRIITQDMEESFEITFGEFCENFDGISNRNLGHAVILALGHGIVRTD
jgi:translation initiation factor eIF-2B subunit alpha